MRIYTFFITSAIILNYTECSSHSGSNTHSRRDPDSPPSPPAVGEQTLEQTPTYEPPRRSRSRSSTGSPSPSNVLGYPLRKLGYIRLISRTNQNLRFEFRKYDFPADKLISWRGNGQSFSHVPAEEHIVLSTSNGDIFAILSYAGVLRGLHKTKRYYPRAKINMFSGEIRYLTPDDIRDCPVGTRNPIFPQSFLKAFSDRDSLRFKWKSDGEIDSGSSPSPRQHSPNRSPTPEESLIRSRSETPPGKPPSDKVLGYTMQQLGYVRLSCPTNPNQRFAFRKYVFPTDKPIRMRIYEKRYVFSPTTEYIVLSTINSDVFAILDHTGTLSGIYRTDRKHSRVKINMISGAVDNMTPDEKTDCPVGRNRPIFPNNFSKELSNFDSLQPNYDPDSEYNPGSSSSARQNPTDRAKSPPGRPPSDEVLGCPLAELGYIRLIPQSNSHRQFEFRRYVFPPYRGIYLMAGHGRFVPLPNREHIVLSTSSGDVFAILEYTGLLRGTYLPIREKNWHYSRIKINIPSGEVDCMTESEMKECHTGMRYPIFSRWFAKVISNENSLQHVYH